MLRKKGQPEAIEGIGKEQDNLRQALTWSLTNADLGGAPDPGASARGTTKGSGPDAEAGPGAEPEPAPS